MTDVFVWSSFSCNNSSDYRLVAEFATSEQASAMAKELAAFFERHAKQYDKAAEEDGYAGPRAPTKAAYALGEKYGVEWSKALTWGDEQLAGDEPSVTAVGRQLVLYHTYSSGGFGPDVPRVLQQAGARLPEKAAKMGPPILLGTLALPAGAKGQALATVLGEFFAQNGRPSEYSPLRGLEIQNAGSTDEYALAIDDASATFSYPIDPQHIPALKQALAKHGAKNLTLRLATAKDVADTRKRGAKLDAARDANVAAEETQRVRRTGSTALPTIAVVARPGDDFVPAWCGATVVGDELYFAGGLGSDRLVASKDGKMFKSRKVAGRGLRSLLVVGTTAWKCGERGALARSASGLTAFAPIETGTASCLYGVAAAPDGAIWVTGDTGFVLRSTNGKDFTRVTGVSGRVSHARSTALGLLLPTASGLYRVERAGVAKLGLTKDVNDVASTPSGALVAVGAKNGIYRSTDGGKTFRAVKVPPFRAVAAKQTKSLRATSWIKAANALNVISPLPDGRLVVGGDAGTVLVSVDDGATFARIEHDITDAIFWASAQYRGAVYLGGENGTILRVG